MRGRLQGIIIGVIIGAILAGMVAFAAPVEKTITAAYNGIKLYVDGALIVPKDAGGSVVEPFIYEGTTYLPVRAVGEALGKPVQWDGTTQSVFIGARPGEIQYLPNVAKAYDSSDYAEYSVLSGTNGYVTVMGEKYYNVLVFNNRWNSGGYGLYNLNGKHTFLSGQVATQDGHGGGTLSFYCDGVLRKEIEISAQSVPIDFSLDLTGVLQLKIISSKTGHVILNPIIK